MRYFKGRSLNVETMYPQSDLSVLLEKAFFVLLEEDSSSGFLLLSTWMGNS